MEKVYATIRNLLQVIGAVVVLGGIIAAVRYTLSIPAVQDFLFGTVPPFLGVAAIALLYLCYGQFRVREEEREAERVRTARRLVADQESADRQEAYFHARGLCLNCKPRLDGEYLKALQATARSDAERTLSRFRGVMVTIP